MIGRIGKRLVGLERKKGQGMTEYIIIVGLIALAAIVIVSLFGQQIKAQFGAMTKALTGEDSTVDTAASDAAATEKDTAGKLDEYRAD